jgi:hypothetical protein
MRTGTDALFGIVFSMLLQYALLFNIARLRAKTKFSRVLIREMLFADDAALVSHTEAGLQAVRSISIKKTIAHMIH